MRIFSDQSAIYNGLHRLFGTLTEVVLNRKKASRVEGEMSRCPEVEKGCQTYFGGGKIKQVIKDNITT